MGTPLTETIVLSSKGSDRREVSVNEIQVPDLWHLAMSYPKDSAEQKAILETWHMAHDLLDNLRGDVG